MVNLVILLCVVFLLVLYQYQQGTTDRQHKRTLQKLMDFLFVFFFGLAGLHLNLSALSELGLIGVIYVVARVIGKSLGVASIKQLQALNLRVT